MTETNEPENLTSAEILEKIRQLEAELHHERDEIAAWYEHG
jgi:hypothetical protein